MPFRLGVCRWVGLGLEGGVWVAVAVSVAVDIAISLGWGRKWSLVSLGRRVRASADDRVVDEERIGAPSIDSRSMVESGRQRAGKIDRYAQDDGAARGGG